MTTYNASITLATSVQSGIQSAARDFAAATIREMASKYGFDAEEAIREYVQVELTVRGKAKTAAAPRKKVEKKVQPPIPMPWCGVVDNGCCTALRLNHGLYTQCTNGPAGDGTYCMTCQKQADKNGGEAVYGTVSQRMAAGMYEYRDPKGKKVVHYGNVLEKLKITTQRAQEVATEFGITIPDSQFDVIRGQRGRPKALKPVAVDDTDSDSSEPKRSRGRPKGAGTKKKTEVSSAADDLIAQLARSAHATPAAIPSPISAPEPIEEPSKKKKSKKDETPEERAARKAAKKAKKEAKKAAASGSDESGDEKKAKKKAKKEAKKERTPAQEQAFAKAQEARKAQLDEKKAVENEFSDLLGGPYAPSQSPLTLLVDEGIDEPQQQQQLQQPVSTDNTVAHTELEEDTIDDEEEEEVACTKITVDGVQYALTADGDVYNLEGDYVGEWDPDAMTIIPDADDEE